MYNSAVALAVSEEDVYVSTGSSIMIYNRNLAELKKLSRIQGLTETGISSIDWSEENKILVIAYSNTNLDLVKDHRVYNISDIARKYIPGKKVINRIRVNGGYAYLATSFGLVVTDLNRREIYDTWKPGTGTDNPEVYDVAFSGGKIFAATERGVFAGDLSNNGLSFYGNWTRVETLPNPAGKYTLIISSGGKLYMNMADPAGDYVWVAGENATLFSHEPGVFNTSFDLSSNSFTISSGVSVKQFNSEGLLLKTISSYGWGTPAAVQAITAGNDIFIADRINGLVIGKDMSQFSSMTLPGPASDNPFSVTSLNGKTIFTSGGTTPSWNNQWMPLKVSVYEDNKWESITSQTIFDPVRALIDPDNNNHFFVASWGGGLLEYENNTLVKQYDQYNSPLQTIISGQAYVRIGGIAMDGNRNLYITQTEVPGSIKILKPDGSWIVNPLTIDAPTIGNIIITKTGQKWIILPRGFGLFILDDNKTPDNFSDDRTKKLLIRDTENRLFSNVYAIAEDLDGNIWVGTDHGPFIYYNPEKVFDEELFAVRTKIPRNDGTNLADYILETETVTSIAIDGANRKWLGTSSSGAYLISADGSESLKNYNMENSPLLSNNILSMAVDNKTGEIWFGTSKGIQSLRGDALQGKEGFSKVYAFPNPVRQDFSGNISITGLMRDTHVRITDVSGNLVYETVSEGGMASWDLKNYNGDRVATGVYLIFCSGNNGKDSAVTKILIMK
jgi:Tfp pilus assembly protein FimT/outer membrane lipoprotein-sorting protein